MSAKFNKDPHNSLVCIWFIAYFQTFLYVSTVTLTFALCLPKSIGSILLPWFNISAKFDQEIHNSEVSIVFTSLFPYMSIVTLAFDHQNQ